MFRDAGCAPGMGNNGGKPQVSEFASRRRWEISLGPATSGDASSVWHDAFLYKKLKPSRLQLSRAAESGQGWGGGVGGGGGGMQPVVLSQTSPCSGKSHPGYVTAESGKALMSSKEHKTM